MEGTNKTAHLAVVYSCFVLHSFCEPKNYSGLDKGEVESRIMRHRLEEQNNINLPDFIYSNSTTEGEYIWSIMNNYIQEHLPDGLNTTEITLSCSQHINFQQKVWTNYQWKKTTNKTSYVHVFFNKQPQFLPSA